MELAKGHCIYEWRDSGEYLELALAEFSQIVVNLETL